MDIKEDFESDCIAALGIVVMDNVLYWLLTFMVFCSNFLRNMNLTNNDK